MVATNETSLEVGITNYPGAAAQPRPSASAGFRGAGDGCHFPRCTGPLNLYYASQWQVVEERWNGTAAADTQYQYVWSEAYVNARVLRDSFAAGVIQPDARIYTTTDANYDVTALITYDPATQTWGISERFVYSPYGSVQVLDANFVSTVDAFNWQYMYQGGRQDAATGLYLFQHRNYSPSLSTWTSQDPLQYINGANTYQFVMSNPVGRMDPWGAFALHGRLFSADAYDGFGGGVAVDYKVDYEKCRCHPGRHKGSASVTASYHFGVGLGEEVDVLGFHENLLLRIGPQISGGTTLKLHKTCLGQWAGSESAHLNVGVGIAGSIGGWLFSLNASGWVKGQLTDTLTVPQKQITDKITGDLSFSLTGSIQLGPTTFTGSPPVLRQPGINEPGTIFTHTWPNPF
jgi:RHS repeat-associated protein